MAMNNSSERYGTVARALHWIIAALIVTQYVLGELAEGAADSDRLVAQIGLLANHKSIGMTILALAVLRLVWRFVSPPPALPSSMPAWQHRASQASHWLLYLLLFALPVTGWLMSSASPLQDDYGIQNMVFGWFAMPDPFIPGDRDVAAFFSSMHEICAKLLFVLILIHAGAALKHHFILKNNVLKRMTFGE